MHLKANINIVEFLEQVKKCDGEVLYETPEGDRIALKSTLSQYIVRTIASNPELLKNGTISFKLEEDNNILHKFLCE